MYSSDIAVMPAATEVNDDIQACITAKRLAGTIRTLKEEIINEMNTWQETNSENCRLEINIHQLEERIKELDILCVNCETYNAEIERQKKRYSEQLTKISKLISEQNFDAVNWAIILDEMVFVNRELFEILLSTAIAERRALQMETIEEEKYRNRAEKLVLKRIGLRQELYSQMNSYESLRRQINQTESSLMNLQKSIDVHDAEYWQLNDARHDLQFQIFQLQELLRQRRCFSSFSKSSSSHTDKDDLDKNANDKCLTTKRKKPNATIPGRKISKKTDHNIANAKFKSQSVSKAVPEIKHDARDKIITKEEDIKAAIKVASQSEVDNKSEYKTLSSLEKSFQLQSPKKMQTKEMTKKEIKSDTSNSSSNIRSSFMWNKKTDPTKDQPIPMSSSVSSSESRFFVEPHKLPFDSKLTHTKNLNGSTSMESFKTTPSQTVANETETKKQAKYSGPVKLIEAVALSPNSVERIRRRKSLSDLKQKKKNAVEVKKVTVDEVDADQDTSTDLQSSNEEDIIDLSKFSTTTNSDDDTTDLTSESISLSDKSSNSINTTPSINSDIEDQEQKSSFLLSNSSEQQIGIREPYYISGSENTSEISTDNKTNSKIRNESDREVSFPGIGLPQQQQQLIRQQPRYDRLLYEGNEVRVQQVESDEQQTESLPLQNQNVELWQEISERTFLRNIANRF